MQGQVVLVVEWKVQELAQVVLVQGQVHVQVQVLWWLRRLE